MPSIRAKPTRAVRIGSVQVGGGAPIAVQSMAATKTQDIEATSAINLSGPVTQTNLAPTSFDLTWPTDVAGDSRVQYGLTPDLGLEVAVTESVTDHSVTLTNLTPGTIYYARVTSTFLFVAVMEAVMLVLFVVLFDKGMEAATLLRVNSCSARS